MPADYPFASVSQGDVAFLEYQGVAYRCYVWQRNTEVLEGGENQRYRGAQIEAAVYTEGPHGQSVLLHRGVVRVAAGSEFVDCPRVVPFGREFHCHWIEYDPLAANGSGRDIHRSTFAVNTSPYEWDHRGAIATSYLHLYDIHTFDADEDYILTHAVSATEIGVYRVNGSTWADNAWTVTEAALTVDQNVLCCVADRSSTAVFYQSGGSLFGLSRRYSDGVSDVAATSIVGSGVVGGEIVAVGATRRGTGADGDIFVIYEYQDATSGAHTVPSVTHFETDTSTLTPSARTTTPNVSLESKPWKYASQRSAAVFTESPMFFCALGYINCDVGNDWLQTCHYIARFEEIAGGRDGQPIPVATLNYGIRHTAMHGKAPVPQAGSGLTSTGGDNTKRRNHLPAATPAPSFGPRQKSYTTFLPTWTRRDMSSAVAGAALRSTTFHHDDPWAYPYDDTDAALPTEPYASVSIPQLENVAAGDGHFFAGGTPQVYDGHRFVECGFMWRPELLDVTEQASGSLANGTYTYVVAAEWRDNRGQTHRVLSDPVAVTTTGGFRVDLEIRQINLGFKDNASLDAAATSPPVKLDVYRTDAGGAVFYPLYRGNADTSVDLVDVPTNDPTLAVITVEDQQPDSTITTRTPLPYSYATGVWAPIPPDKPPALAAAARWQNRIFGVAAEDPAVLWYSQEILPEIGGERYSVPEFSSDLTFRIDGVGRVVAMREMDSALILFTADSIYALRGLPADSTGAGSSLQLQTLQLGTGCIEPRSVASAPDGIYFQSRRGFYHLGRQNVLTYVGADVEDELRAAGNVRAVTVHEDSHQVRLLCNGAAYDSPQVLVYDWLMKLWAVWPLPTANSNNGRSSAVDAVNWRGHIGQHAHVVALSSGVFIQKSEQSASRYADESGTADTVAIPVDVRTGWIHLAGLAGFKRVRKIGLTLTKEASAAYTVEIEYDLDGSQTDGANLQTETVPATTSGYHEFRTNIQKCTSIRLRFYEGTAIPTGDQLTARTVNLHAITLWVAQKPGPARVSPTTQRT